MSYFNPLLRPGIEWTLQEAGRAGVDGFIIPDMIPEEGGELRQLCSKNDLSLIFLAAPNTPDERLISIDRESGAFVYVVSLTGVTGARKTVNRDISQYLKRTKRYISMHPRFVGFGISRPEQVKALKRHVDGIIVGSAFVEIIRKSKNVRERNEQTARLVRSLRRALD
jgi:tryptophan synthase alpha chain